MKKEEFLKLFAERGGLHYCAGDDTKINKDWHENIAESRIEELNESLHGIYFAVNRFPPGNRTKETCTRIRAVFCEDDKTGKLRKKWPIEPSLIVESSPGKFHYYWLTTTKKFDEYNRVMQTMVNEYNCDPKARDISRVLRVPETFNHKKHLKKPFKVRIVGGNKRKYPWNMIIIAFPPADKKRPTHSDKDGNFDIEEAVEQLLTSSDYHGSLTSMAMSFVSRGDSKTAFLAFAQAAYTAIMLSDASEDRKKEATDRFSEGPLIKECWESAVQKVEKENVNVKAAIKRLKSETEVPSKEFPIKLLPENIRAMATEAARVFKVPVEVVALLGVSFSMIAMGIRFHIKEREHMNSYPSIGIVPILEPGEYKSSLLNPLKKYFFKEALEARRKKFLENSSFERTMNDGLRARIKAVQEEIDKLEDPDDSTYIQLAEEKAILEAQLEPEENRKGIGKPPELFYADATTEATEQKLFDNGGEAALVTPEGVDMVDSILGSNHRGKVSPTIYNKGIANDPISSDRIIRGSQHIDMACLNVFAMMQHDAFLELISAKGLLGLLGRIIFVRPNSLVGQRLENANEEPIDWGKFSKLKTAIESAFNSSDVTVRLDPEANELRRKFFNEIETKMGDGNEYSGVTDLVNKMCTFSVKLASGIYGSGLKEPITGVTVYINKKQMRNAIKLTRFFFDINLDTVANLRTREVKAMAIELYEKAVEYSKEYNKEWIPKGQFFKTHFSNNKDEILDAAFSLLVIENLVTFRKKTSGYSFKVFKNG